MVVSEEGEQCIENVLIRKIAREEIAECANNGSSHYKYFLKNIYLCRCNQLYLHIKDHLTIGNEDATRIIATKLYPGHNIIFCFFADF